MGESYPSTEMQLLHSTAAAEWAKKEEGKGELRQEEMEGRNIFEKIEPKVILCLLYFVPFFFYILCRFSFFVIIVS